MVDFTEKIKLIENLYNEQHHEKAIEKIADFIVNIDNSERANFEELYYLHYWLFNCYFRLNNAVQCEKCLKECMRYAEPNEPRRAFSVLSNTARLYVVTNRIDEAMSILEDCINFYTEDEDIEATAKMIIWKGEATKDIKYYKEALDLFKQVDKDTTKDEEFAKRRIKELRHLC